MFKRFASALIYGNFWVAAGAVALAASTMVLLGRFSVPMLGFIYCATFTMYAYARNFLGAGRQGVQLSAVSTWALQNPIFSRSTALVGALGALYFFTQLIKSTWPWLGGCLILGLLYPLPLGGYLKGLRHMAGLKAFIVCTVWAIVTVVLPAAEGGADLDSKIALLAMQRFLFTLSIAIAFDIRDVRLDCGSMKTIPQQIGIKHARSMALFSLFLAEAGALLFYFSEMISPGVLIGQLLTFEATGLLLWRTTPRKPDFFFSFWVEGATVLHFVLVFIFNYFWP